mmetsp:Transcript_1182/g.2605  ORF Transcript_1182/g.2605 Transcript_1182/m.2605 type:complete len:368 (-) Transcript_1182:51-1154(-)
MATTERACPNCSKAATLRCSRCHAAWYCSPECQRVCWPTHRAVCPKPKKAAPAVMPTNQRNSMWQQQLMAAGMSCEESSDAIDIAIAEGRDIGTPAQEKKRAAARAAAEVTISLPAVEDGWCNVLMIDGANIAGDWMAKKFLGKACPEINLLAKPQVPAKWASMRLRTTLADFHRGRANSSSAVVRAIQSGVFHAILVCDLSDCFDVVEQNLGPLFQRFTNAGGCIAFTTGEGLLLCPVLGRLFGTAWKPSGYYRTMWQRSNSDSAARSFPNAPASYSANSSSLTNVPEQERIFGTVAGSRTKPADPNSAGREVRAGDISVAVHDCGSADGSIAFFGDVNQEDVTMDLVLSYLRARSPSRPPTMNAS